jgi:hypothetical protein
MSRAPWRPGDLAWLGVLICLVSAAVVIAALVYLIS